MDVTAESVATSVGMEACAELSSALSKIEHCLAQLTDEQLWHRAADDMNSIANLLLHLAGNLRQWIISGIGGAADVRNRPSEFTQRLPLPRANLLERLHSTVREARATLSRVTAEELLRTRRIQGFDVTGMQAIFESVAHFRGHSQEIVHMTRLLLGSHYRFDFVPQTPEQGARQS